MYRTAAEKRNACFRPLRNGRPIHHARLRDIDRHNDSVTTTESWPVGLDCWAVDEGPYGTNVVVDQLAVDGGVLS